MNNDPYSEKYHAEDDEWLPDSVLKPEYSPRKKRNKKLFKLLRIVMGLCFILIFVIYYTKEFPSASNFRDYFEGKQYKISETADKYNVDLIDENTDNERDAHDMKYMAYLIDEYVSTSLFAEKDNIHIEFFELDSREGSKKMFDNLKSFASGKIFVYVSKGGTDYSYESDGSSSSNSLNFQKYYGSARNEHYLVFRYKNTVTYAYCDRSDTKILHSDASEFIPPNLLLIIFLYIFGGILLFVSVFLMLEERKQKAVYIAIIVFLPIALMLLFFSIRLLI